MIVQAKFVDEAEIIGLSLAVEKLRACVDGIDLATVVQAQGGDVAPNCLRGLEQLDVELPGPVPVDQIRGKDPGGSSADDDHGGESA
jgi:hypothetical protein